MNAVAGVPACYGKSTSHWTITRCGSSCSIWNDLRHSILGSGVGQCNFGRGNQQQKGFSFAVIVWYAQASNSRVLDPFSIRRTQIRCVYFCIGFSARPP